MAKRHNDKPYKRPAAAPDPADVWADVVALKAARAMALWLKQAVHLSRPISSLKVDEMKVLATTAIHTWIIAASQRLPVVTDPEERKRLKTLLD